MTRRSIIERTINAINGLPQNKVEEISDFVEFIKGRYEEEKLQQEIQMLVSESEAFEFLNEEEDIYSVSDLKELYNA